MSSNIVWHEGHVSYSDRCKVLNQRGLVLWFTGLSGSGKSTLAVALERQLINQGKLVYRLDGDNIRHGLNKDLGFNLADREENVRRIAEVARLFADSGVITLASFISPLKKMRENAKKIIGTDIFHEIYVECSLEKCQERDPKGLYKKALSGEIRDFTGISSSYERPDYPDLTVNTSISTLPDSVKYLSNYVENKIKIN